jgi:hypothetical protein
MIASGGEYGYGPVHVKKELAVRLFIALRCLGLAACLATSIPRPAAARNASNNRYHDGYANHFPATGTPDPGTAVGMGSRPERTTLLTTGRHGA